MTDAEFIACARSNPINAAILDRGPALGLTDAWLVSGSLFQTVWNCLADRPPAYGIKDYDIFYFDPDTSYEAEDRQIRRVGIAFADINAKIELRNQARVHLWYGRHFGDIDYPPLRTSCEGIDRFLAVACKVGISLDGRESVYAPDGFGDIEEMVIQPNPSNNFSAEHYAAKSARWRDRWPELSIEPVT